MTAKPGGGITLKPGVTEADVQAKIAAAPDAGAHARTTAPVVDGGRKKPISLTIDAKLLAELDKKAKALGLSRAAGFALAVSRFVAAEEREANR
ncbi:ribbon-helix-helix protein, CopG family [Pseudoduganella sp. FT55W]|uniref:Ribbon-helix-helix protein, CopG family n=1 Tax=Duganella rivi TaxID=2666083 RepID=A0A7X4GVM3_9BURK|nr:ribbon-helix-helix protein, CopG family [Duganella rivi]MYM70513.1 ribbon-helix-helix protein, CopG family [Duganella rivi]